MSDPLWIRGGRVIDPANDREEDADVFAREGLIVENLSDEERSHAQTIDAVGKIVCPGFIDLHAHFREPGQSQKETIGSGSKAAMAGGFTTVIIMPDVTPPADNAGVIQYILDAVAKHACVNVLPTGCITQDRAGQNLAPIGSLKQAGVVAITDSPDSPQNNEIMRRTLEYAGMFDLTIIDQCSDLSLTEGACMHEGPTSLRLGLPGSPRVAEDLFVARATMLSALTGSHVHLQCISSGSAVDVIRRAKSRGVKITSEVTPHHLSLTDEAIATYDPRYKTKPPLREEPDRQALIEGLLDGTIDCVATDHEPHVDYEKDVEFDQAPFGVIGLETALPVCLQVLVRDGTAELTDLIRFLSTNPARILGLDKGTLAPGYDADVIVFDPDETWTVQSDALESLSANSPWLGEKMQGRVTHVVVSGHVVQARDV
ncbi:MAG: dihydroorotase [Opitutales bacterium]